MRQFILQNEIPKNNLIVLKEKDFRYLRKVLRLKNGDALDVRTKEGDLRNAEILKIDDKARSVTLKICEKISAAESDFPDNQNKKNDAEFWLFQFLPRPQKFEQIARQATECGVNAIIPILGEYSEKSSASVLENSKKARIEKIIKEARQQSGSPVQTKIFSAVSLENACKLWLENLKNLKENQKSLAFVLSERGERESSLLKIIQNADNQNIEKNEKTDEKENCAAQIGAFGENSESKSQNERKIIKKVAIAVGCEGGISPREILILQKCGFTPIHFNVNILRCETAALYGIAAAQSMIL